MRKRSTFRVFTASEKTKPTSNPPKPDYPLNQTSLSARPTLAHLTHLLQKCSNCRALQQGKQIHQLTIVHGFCDSYLCTKLVHVYVRCSEIVPALQLFNQMPQRNVFAWTSIIEFYSQKFMYRECLQLYYQMIEEGVEPDGYVFPKVLRACAHLRDLNEGVRLHNRVKECDLRDNLQVANALIEMYAKCGELSVARQVFDEMGERDLISWNSMLAGYVNNGQLDLGLEVFNDMRSKGLDGDLVTWNTMIAGYSKVALCEEALKMFNCLRTSLELKPNHISWTSLILGFSRGGRYREGLMHFREMMGASVAPDADILSCVLSCCRHIGALGSGQEIHAYGLKRIDAFKFYDSAGGALMTIYGMYGMVEDAWHVFEFMDKGDVVSWNAMIMGLVHCGQAGSALRLFADMQLQRVQHDHVTIATVLPACSSLSALKLGKQIHTHVLKSPNVDSATIVWNALIDMYARNGQVRDSYTVFENMSERDIVSWNAMIGAYGMHGHGQCALDLFNQMKGSGLKPNHTTFTSILAACSHSGLMDDGWRYFHSMVHHHGLIPMMEQYSCMVDMLGRAGRLEEAMSFIDAMPFEPDASIWGAMLAACRVHQNVHFGRIAAERLFVLEPENPGNYITLSNIYVRVGRWDDAASVRRRMESRALMKPSGCSWIEAEGH
ncbi:hypothetical protein AMTRI_Chr04g248740 [Amborella trichopoda]